jgi:hypothetical protein
MGFLTRMKALFGAAPTPPAAPAVAEDMPGDEVQMFLTRGGKVFNLPMKTGVQTGAMSDPLGKRVYHEYFVGEDRGDGHYPWLCRVYSGGIVKEVKEGLATTPEAARKQANDYGLAMKKQVLGAP